MDFKKIVSGKTDNTFIQFFRYLFVGGGATVVQYVIMILLKEAFGVDANIGNAFGFMGGLVTNYMISTYWVFDKAAVKNKAAEFTAFALIGVVGLGINQGLIWLFDKPLASRRALGALIPERYYYILGQLIATGVTFFWNFFARKYLLFNKDAEERISVEAGKSGENNSENLPKERIG